MAAPVYILCMLTALLCAVLLLNAYRRSRYRLLLWSGVCFGILALNNALLVVDKLVYPTEIDLQLWRTGSALIAMLILVYGLIMESE
jgi:hypothetical protein